MAARIRWASLVLGLVVTTLALTMIGTALVGDYQLVVAGRPLPSWIIYVGAGVGTATGLSLILQVVTEARVARRAAADDDS